MSDVNSYAGGFTRLISRAQRAYAERRLEEYLSAFDGHYTGARLGRDDLEDMPMLATRIEDDFRRFELLGMDYSILRHWYAGETAFAHMRYETRLRSVSDGALRVDKRENLIVGRHIGGDKWLIVAKITLPVTGPPPPNQLVAD
jgi:hypothetical protein